MRTRAKISLCMIVKNEEHNLPGCLDSAAELVDEIVVVDTGSTDRTKAVAVSRGARVVDFAWRDSFAAARNEGLRLAMGDWIFWLDADERPDDSNRQRLRELFAGLKEENAAYTMRQLSPARSAAGMAAFVVQVRLFRRDERIRWEYRVHEQILPALKQCNTDIRHTEIAVAHHGYQDPDRLRAKLERNARLLRLANAEQPNNSFILYNLGFACLDLGGTEEAASLLQRSLELVQRNDPIVRKLFAVLARSQGKLGQPAKAFTTLQTGLSRFPDDPELLFVNGVLLAEAGNYAEAEANLKHLQTSSEVASFANVHPGIRTYLARHYLAGVYRAQHRPGEAEAAWSTALAQSPSYMPALRGLAELYAH